MKLPERGMELGEWVLEERLGAGAFGQVWRGRHNLFKGLHVALKIPHTKDAIESLAKEGVIQAELDHPGIVKALGIDPDSDPPYFVMDYVDGSNLREYLVEKGPLPLAEVESILRQILDALAYAHERGVIHQDIKPENVLILPDGTVKLTDFGLGMTVGGESLMVSLSLKSQEPEVRGTLPYIAPEIRDGEGEIDARADLYSLGILFCEMLTGKRPAGAELPTHLRPGLPPWCDALMQKLYVRRENRFASARAVVEFLDRGGRRKAPPQPPRLPPASPPWQSKFPREMYEAPTDGSTASDALFFTLVILAPVLFGVGLIFWAMSN